MIELTVTNTPDLRTLARIQSSDQVRAEDPIHLAQDMRFKAAIRGWSHKAQQLRDTALLNLNDISLVREMQENHDLILLPPDW